MDTFDKSTRSKIMSAVKSRGNKTTERRFRMLLVKNKIKGWKIGDPTVPGKPDFNFRERRIAIFVDGCFWHGCPKCYSAPKTSKLFWREKVNYNRKHDAKISGTLKKTGWLVFRFWEHEVNRQPSAKVKKVLEILARVCRSRKSG